MNLDPVFDAAGRSWNVDPDLLRAIAGQESGGKDSAVSPAGAQGRMQVMPNTFRGLGGTDINDPVQNIYASAKYMSQGLDAEKGNPQQALLYYHGGPGWRSKYGSESANYVPGVSAHYQAIQAAKAKQSDGGADVRKQTQAPAATDDDEAAGKTLIDQLTAGAGKPAAQPQGQPATSAAPANDDDEAAGRALVDRLSGPATKTAAAPAAPAASNAVLGHLPGASSVTSDAPMPTMPSGLPGVPDDSDTLDGLPPGGNTGPGSPVLNALKGMPTTAEGYRNLLADKPGWTASSVLPMRVKNDAQGNPDPKLGVEWDLGPMRGVGRGVVDLLDAPYTTDPAHPQLSPEATSVLFGAAAGGQLAPSVARGTGAAIADTAAYGAPLNALYGKNRPVAAPGNAPAGNALATEVPPGPSPGMEAPQPQSGGAAVPASGEVVNGWRRMTPGEPMAPGQEIATDAHGQQWVRADGAPQFLDSAWIKQQGSDAAGKYDPNIGGDALAATVDAALKRGDSVTLAADGGRKTVQITGVKDGMMVDAQGQRWGSSSLATDASGKEGVQITPRPDTSAGARDIRSSVEARMTPDEILAERHRAEKDWLNSTIQPGVEDNRLLVQGNNPTLAQREQNAATSREQKSLTQQNPQLAQEEQELLDQHDTNRKRMYQQPDLAGSTVLLNNAEKAAKAKLDAGLNAAFANKTAANAQPVVEMADEMLSGRSGKRLAIETEVRGVRSRLFDADGNLETDPEILWGVREHINDVLSKENQRQNPVSGRAQSELIKLRDALDGVIDPAAPGFRAAIKGYAEEMKAPDVMRALQERENGLYDSKGRMQFSRFHSLMRDIVDARQPGAALSPFQHISDQQMAKLQNLHDDLKRAATAQDLAAARGSDTAQNLWDAARTYAKGRGTAAINMIPYVGGLVRHGQEAYAPYKEMKAQQNALNRGIEMLRPPPDKYPTRNPLAD